MEKNFYLNGRLEEMETPVLKKSLEVSSETLRVSSKLIQVSSETLGDHYRNSSRIECIEIARHLTFSKGNALKYLWRLGAKKSATRLQELIKSRYYLRDALAHPGILHGPCATLEDTKEINDVWLTFAEDVGRVIYHIVESELCLLRQTGEKEFYSQSGEIELSNLKSALEIIEKMIDEEYE